MISSEWSDPQAERKRERNDEESASKPFFRPLVCPPAIAMRGSSELAAETTTGMGKGAEKGEKETEDEEDKDEEDKNKEEEEEGRAAAEEAETVGEMSRTAVEEGGRREAKSPSKPEAEAEAEEEEEEDDEVKEEAAAATSEVEVEAEDDTVVKDANMDGGEMGGASEGGRGIGREEGRTAIAGFVLEKMSSIKLK